MIEKNRLRKEKLIAKSLSAFLWWFIALSIAYLLVFVAAPIDYSQLIQPHILGKRLAGSRPGYILDWIFQEYDIALLAAGAFIFLIRKERNFFLIPFLTFILGILIFSTHSPIWYHHRLLILVPMCWLASFSIYKLFSRQVWKGWRDKNKALKIKDAITIVFLSLILILTAVRIPLKYKRLTKETAIMPLGYTQLTREVKGGFPDDYGYVIYLMKQYRERTHMVVTDRPIFAFYANLPGHPYLATSSFKRIITGLLTVEDYINIICKEHPELILFARLPQLVNKIVPHIEETYELEYQNSDNSIRLYILKGIKRNKEKGY